MRHELFRSIELLSKTFPFCNCFNRTIHWRDNRNISKKNHLWTMQKLSWAYFGPYTQNAIFHVEIYSVGNFFPSSSLYIFRYMVVNLIFPACTSQIHPEQTRTLNTFELFHFFVCCHSSDIVSWSSSHLTLATTNLFLCIVCRSRHIFSTHT